MSSSCKSSLLVLSAVLALTQLAAKKEAPKKTEAAAKGGKKEAKGSDEMEMPVPKGQPQKGVRVPLYDAAGKLKMRFEIGVGTWLDDTTIKMEKLRVETFKDDGTTEFDMDLPDATLNKKTREITSQTRVKVKSSQYEITGNSMTFNIETKSGTLGGGVKMIVYDKEDLSAEESKEKKTTIEFQPAKPPAKIEIK